VELLHARPFADRLPPVQNLVYEAGPSTGPPSPVDTMRISPERLAAAMAREDGEPRILRQAAAVFLATPLGEVWRIFDCELADGNARRPPTSGSTAAARVFIGSEEQDVALIYRFADGEARSLTAEQLYEQLRAAVPCEAL
jgi:hypothetical protein